MEQEIVKFCSFCGVDHLLTEEFWFFKVTAKGNPTYRCKKRDLDCNREWCEKNEEQRKQVNRAWYVKNKMPDLVCDQCGEKLSRKRKSGLCKLCCKRKYQQDNPDKIKKSQSKWYQNNREAILAKNKAIYVPGSEKEKRRKRYEKNKDREIERSKAWQEKNKDKFKAYAKEWREQNADIIKEKHAEHYQKNKEKINKRTSEWQKANRDKVNIRWRHRMKTDPQFKLGVLLRIRLNEALKNNHKTGSAVKDLGCSIADLKVYLEGLFYPDPVSGTPMTWDNWTKNSAGWQIDHIKPMTSFDLTDPAQLKEACHHTNLRPLWHADHILKSIEERR